MKLQPGIAFILMFLLHSLANAQSSASSGQSPASAPLPNGASVVGGNTPANQIVQAAQKGGVLSCAARIGQVTGFLANGNQNGAFLFTPGQTPDKNLFSVSLEVSPVSGPMAYASASFAPNQANGCAGVFDSVIYWPKRCEEIASTSFSSFKAGGKLGKNITVLGAGSTRVFLMPADQGCISIIKEVLL